MHENLIVDAKGVTFAYGAAEEGKYHFALNGVDIDVPRGAFVVILGHNGSGKSTFAKLINALERPSTGRVVVDGMDTAQDAHLMDIRRTAGMVFQNPDNQLVATVVEEDVAFGPENLGVPQPEIVARVEQALETVGMLKFRKRAPHMLSGGQKQRVAIAGSLAMQPKLIVFDEATAMLDPLGRDEVLATMHRLNREQGITILFITHFLEEAANADHVVVMSQGMVAGQGAPAEVLYDAALLDQAGLMPPFAVQLNMDLRAAGVPLAQTALTPEQLVEELCQLQ